MAEALEVDFQPVRVEADGDVELEAGGDVGATAGTCPVGTSDAGRVIQEVVRAVCLEHAVHRNRHRASTGLVIARDQGEGRPIALGELEFGRRAVAGADG